MENDIQNEKPRKVGAIKTAALVIGVLAVGTVMSLTGRNSPNQCGCLPPSTEPGKKELYRHQGFFAKEEILSKWDELGVDLTK